MKTFIICLLCIATASAGFYDAINSAGDEAVFSFVNGLNNAQALAEVLGKPQHGEGLQQVENDIKVELGCRMKVVVYDILERVQLTVEENRQIHAEFTRQITKYILDVQEVTLQQKEEISEEEHHEITKNRVKNFLKLWQEQIDNVNLGLHKLYDHLEAISLKSLVARVKHEIVEHLNFHAISTYLKNVLGEAHHFLTSIISAIFEKGKHLLEDIVDHFLPAPESSPTAVAKRLPVFSIRAVSCFIVGLVTKGFGMDYIVDWIRSKVPENWKGTFFELLSRGGLFLLKWGAKSLCLGAASAKKASLIANLVHKVHSLLEHLGLTAQEDFFRFADWMKSVWGTGIEQAEKKFDQLYTAILELTKNVQSSAAENLMGLRELLVRYKDIFGRHWEEVKAVLPAPIDHS